MKIFCIGRNYGAHARELGNPLPDEPVVFMKPHTALLRPGRPFYPPAWSTRMHYEGEIVVRIGRNGKYVEPRFARRYVDALTIGIDFTERDWQDKLKSKGHPWELAKAFDHSAAIGEWVDARGFDLSNLQLEFEQNGKVVQKAVSSDMIFPIEEVIAWISRFITLQKGDLLFTGTPEGVGEVHPGDYFTGRLQGTTLLRCEVK